MRWFGAESVAPGMALLLMEGALRLGVHPVGAGKVALLALTPSEGIGWKEIAPSVEPGGQEFLEG